MHTVPVVAIDDPAADSPADASIFKPGLVYGGAVFANLDGGLRQGSGYSSNLNLQLNIDAAALIGWTGVGWFLGTQCIPCIPIPFRQLSGLGAAT